MYILDKLEKKPETINTALDEDTVPNRELLFASVRIWKSYHLNPSFSLIISRSSR
jgi:hypothetical protein